MSVIEFRVERNDLDEVIADLEEFRVRVPLAVSRAVQPKKWREAAFRRASLVLRELAETMEEHELAVELAASVTARFWSAGALGMEWALGHGEEGVDVAQATADRSRGPLLEFANREQINQLFGFLVQWVATVKRKDARDRRAGGEMKSDEEIARGLFHILLGGSEEKVAARAKLLPHIQKYIDERAREVIGPERMEAWLNAVLDGWGELVNERVVDAVADEVLKELKPNKRK
jgi:hypothetical protein